MNNRAFKPQRYGFVGGVWAVSLYVMNVVKFSLERITRSSKFVLVTSTLLGLGTVSAQAQQLPMLSTIRLSPEDLERGQHGVQQNFFFLPPGKTGEDYQSAGFFGQKLRPYINSNPEAVAELNDYRRQKTLYLVDKAFLLGSAAVYASQVFSHGDPVYFNGTQQVAIGVAVVSILATTFINRHTNEYLKQAVDNYNSGPVAGRKGTLLPRLRPAGVGLASTPQGQPLVALHWHL
jgi:hypothetical protein